jgi:hypothetical protein
MALKFLGTEFKGRFSPQVIVNDDPANPKPGFGWQPSLECLAALKEQEDNMRMARLNAAQIVVD